MTFEAQAKPMVALLETRPEPEFDRYRAELASTVEVSHGTATSENLPPIEYSVFHGGSRFAAIAPGLFGCKGMLDPLARQLAGRGYTVATYGQARLGNRHIDDLLRPQVLHIDAFDSVLDTIASQEDMSGVDLSQVDSISHSMGTHAVLEYALRHPSEVRSATALAPSGVDRAYARHFIPRLPRVTTEFLRMTGKYIHESSQRQQIKEHVRQNPGLLIGELANCLTSRANFHRAQKLGEMGIATTFVGFNADHITPSRDIRKAAEEARIEFRLLDIPHAGHDAVIHHAEDVAELMLDVHSAAQ